MDKIQKILSGMSVYVRRAWDAKMPIGWELPERYIYDFELLYVKEGSIEVLTEGKRFIGTAGELFFFVPGQIHSIKSIGTERVRQPHIHFDFYYDELSESLESPIKMPQTDAFMRKNVLRENPLLNVPRQLSFKDPYSIDNLIQKIIVESANKNPLSIIRCKSLMFELLYLIFNNKFIGKENNCVKGNALDVVENANGFMQRNCDRAITTAEVAKHVGYSTNYFVTIYKSVSGISPMAYHEKLRIEKAKNFILTTNLSMSEVADELGFDNLYSFSRYFKRLTGYSPLEYRTENNKNDKRRDR